MKQKEGLVLRKIGNQYIIVDTDGERSDLSDVYTMNETAADIWRKMEEGICDRDEIASWLNSEYDVDMDTALKDVMAQTEEWKKFGLIIE